MCTCGRLDIQEYPTACSTGLILCREPRPEYWRSGPIIIKGLLVRSDERSRELSVTVRHYLSSYPYYSADNPRGRASRPVRSPEITYRINFIEQPLRLFTRNRRSPDTSFHKFERANLISIPRSLWLRYRTRAYQQFAPLIRSPVQRCKQETRFSRVCTSGTTFRPTSRYEGNCEGKCELHCRCPRRCFLCTSFRCKRTTVT